MKRPWSLQDYRLGTTRTYATIESALATALVMTMHDPIGTEVIVQNKSQKEAWRVEHMSGHRVLVKKMLWGARDEWLA